MYYLKDFISDSIFPIIPAIILGSSYKKQTAALKLFFYYLLSTSLVFSISNILANQLINNLFLYHFYTVFNFCIITVFLNMTYNLFSKIKYLVIFLFAVTLLCLSNSLFIEKINTFDSNSVIFTNVLLILLCLWGLIKSISNLFLLEHLKYYSLLITFGFFVYSAASIIVYSYLKYMSLFGQRTSNKVWFLYDDIMILKYCCFIIACILWRKRI